MKPIKRADIFKEIIGLPLSDMWRYSGFQKFEFGKPDFHKNKKGEER
jgi:hypothetical protein